MKILVLCSVLALAYLGYEAYRMRPLMDAASKLVQEAKPFSRSAGTEKMLVLGDSTAVGVGAERPEDSIAGRMSHKRPEWSIENHAQSGARIHDLASQVEKALDDTYALIVVQIGANDIIRMKSSRAARKELEPILKSLTKKSDTIVLLVAGNVGGSQFFPALLNPLYERLTLAYHAAFEDLARELSITYVNLYTPPKEDPFVLEPQIYLAPDGLHPSSHGYRLWHEHVEATL